MFFMRHKFFIIILLLMFTLLIQNTCPHGFAGKSSVTASCSQCPYKQTHAPATEGKALGSISNASAHLPMFVLDVPITKPIFRLTPIASPQPVIPNTYKNTAPDELLHPPRA